MRRSVLVAAVLVVVAIAGAVAYQTAARERDYRGLLARGDSALRGDQTFVAIEAYSGAIALHPDSMLAHLRRGETYQRRGELDEAARDFRMAASLDPTATRPLEALGDVLYQMKRFDRAAETYASDLRLDERSATVSYKLALAKYRSGDCDGALTTLATTVRINDRLADPQYLLGLCLRERHRNAEAIQAFEKAVSLAPGLLPAREELADLYAAAGRHSEELDQLQTIAGLDRDHIERQVALALAQARTGHEELAVLTLDNALTSAPDQPLVYRALGEIWLDRAQAHNDRVFLSKALEALTRVASGPTATSDVLTLYGRALLLNGQNDLAEHALEQASTRFPVESSSLVLYAIAAESQGHFDEARQALIDYTGLASDDGDLVTQAAHIAALSVKLNDPRAAVQWLQRAIEKTPDDGRLATALADAQQKLEAQERRQADPATAGPVSGR
jgi:tetratricopeptide (TPR) repeat protein